MRTVKQHWKTLALATMMLAGMGSAANALAAASKQNVMCVKTNTGHYFPVVRVSMMVIPDGGSTFEIVLKDGEGEAGVESISFEKHEEEIDFSLYKTESDGSPYIDLSKPSAMLTSTGKYFLMKDLPQLKAKEGSNKFDIEIGGSTEKDVEFVYFFRGSEENALGIESTPYAPATEKLQLQTPVSQQLLISGCGNAAKAVVYSVDGKQVSAAAVSNGVATIYVGQLPAGVYVVSAGNKALKFTKK